MSEGVLRKIILSYTYVAIWIFLSFTVIVYNKYILDRKMYNCPYPISLTMIHMGFCSSLVYVLVDVVKVVEPVQMSRDVSLKSVVPISLLISFVLLPPDHTQIEPTRVVGGRRLPFFVISQPHRRFLIFLVFVCFFIENRSLLRSSIKLRTLNWNRSMLW